MKYTKTNGKKSFWHCLFGGCSIGTDDGELFCSQHKHINKAQALRQQIQTHIVSLHELIGVYGWSDEALQSLDQFETICDDWLEKIKEKI